MLTIGVFDSGLGGLTVVQEMRKLIKGAKLYYLADTKHAPYGDKTQAEILDYSLHITQYFLDHYAIDALIIACNTATSAAISTLRERFPELVIIGAEPGVKPAIEQSITKKVGVLATKATLDGGKYKHLAETLSSKHAVSLFEQSCVGLVEQIEKGETESPKTRAMLWQWLEPMQAASVDMIVLGCTHYPMVAALIEELMHHKVTLVHTGEAISLRLLSLLEAKGHENHGALEIHVCHTSTINKHMITQLLGEVEVGYCSY